MYCAYFKMRALRTLPDRRLAQVMLAKGLDPVSLSEQPPITLKLSEEGEVFLACVE